jgi:hypothetical protein
VKALVVIVRMRRWRQPLATGLALLGVVVIYYSSKTLQAVPPSAIVEQRLREAEARVQAAVTRAEMAESALQSLHKRAQGATLPAAAIVSSPSPPARVGAGRTPRLTTDSLSAMCRRLAPAVAVRPAPNPAAASSQTVVKHSPWTWADSPAKLEFDPDGIVGALSTPWGEGRWGSLPRQPSVLWADFASRSHLLWVRGCSLVSHRCQDNETVLVQSSDLQPCDDVESVFTSKRTWGVAEVSQRQQQPEAEQRQQQQQAGIVIDGNVDEQDDEEDVEDDEIEESDKLANLVLP